MESLYGAFKDDIQHVITISEFLVMVKRGLKKCLKFLQRINVKFPEIGMQAWIRSKDFDGRC